MSIESIVAKRNAALVEVGKIGLNIQYPDEFEYYLCALELTDATGKSLRYFVFPVMPTGMDEVIPQATNVKKTAGGITVLSTPTFIPTDITLSGNFGRKFRVVLGSDLTDIVSSFNLQNAQNGLVGAVANVFDNRIKTGYGCIKILQDIIYQSNQPDSTGVRRLIFYNLALGNSYLVKAMPLKYSQSQDSNMIWNYNLQLLSIAPLAAIQSAQQQKSQRERLDTTGFVQTSVNNVVNTLNRVIGNGANSLTNKFTNAWK